MSEKVAEEAKVAWTRVLCDKITFAGSAKEMWESLNKLATYQEYNRGGVLPLIDEEGKAVFDRGEKCSLLERVFFGGKHLEECSFDEQFRKEVERAVLDTEMDSVPEKSEKELKNCNEFLNHEISMEEVEAVLQLLKTNKSLGPDEVFTVVEECWRSVQNSYFLCIPKVLE